MDAKKKRLLFMAAMLPAIVGIIGILATLNAHHSIIVPQSVIQAAIQQKLPIRLADNLLGQMDLRSAQVAFAQDSLLAHLGMEVRPVFPKKSFEGEVTLRGAVSYNKSDYKFYFIPDQVNVRATGDNAEIVDKVLNRVDAAQLVKKSIGMFPIYYLPDGLKSGLIKLALERVEIVDQALVFHLSVWQFTKAVLIFCLSAVFGLILVLGIAFSSRHQG